MPLLVHIVGIVIILFGLSLFAYEQIKKRDDRNAGFSAWKVNLQGPPTLILVGAGILTFLAPFFIGTPEPVTGAPENTTSTTVFVDTTGSETTAPQDFPLSPYGYDVLPADDACGAEILTWYTDDETVENWLIIVDVYDLEGEYVDSIELDTATESTTYVGPFLCYWDFFWSADVTYQLFVYSYNEVGYSEDALVIEYP